MPTDTGILTADQRETLQGDPEEGERRYAREQVRNALARDALVLWESLRSDEIRRVFQSTDREPAERADSTADGEQATDGDRNGEAPEALRVESGTAALVAFLYLGLEGRSDRGTDGFEAVLRNAMERVARRNGWVLDEFEFTVAFDRDPDDEKLRRRFDEGTATIEEATELLRRDVITDAEYAGYAQNR